MLTDWVVTRSPDRQITRFLISAICITFVNTAIFVANMSPPTTMSMVRSLARLLPRSWRQKTLEALKREYRLGWPAAVGYASELNLLEVVVAHYAQRHSRINFLQVGACDGVLGDALFPLVQRYRMNGVLIEPRAAMFEKLKQNYAACDGNFVFVNAAIMPTDGTQNLYSTSNVPSVPDYLEGAASFDKKVVLKGLQLVRDPESLIVVEPVKTMTFATLFRTYSIGSIDLLQIDAEGCDAEIIAMFDIPQRRPAIVRFEHMHLSPQQYDSVLRLLTGCGYSIGISQFDTIAYLHGDAPDLRDRDL